VRVGPRLLVARLRVADAARRKEKRAGRTGLSCRNTEPAPDRQTAAAARVRERESRREAIRKGFVPPAKDRAGLLVSRDATSLQPARRAES